LDPVKRGILADKRLAIITGKTGYPIIVFTQTQAGAHQFAVNVRGCIHDPGCEPVNGEFLKIFPGCGRIWKRNRNFANVNNGGPD